MTIATPKGARAAQVNGRNDREAIVRGDRSNINGPNLVKEKWKKQPQSTASPEVLRAFPHAFSFAGWLTSISCLTELCWQPISWLDEFIRGGLVENFTTATKYEASAAQSNGAGVGDWTRERCPSVRSTPQRTEVKLVKSTICALRSL